MLQDLEIHNLDASEISLAREIAFQNCDLHARYVVARLPAFFDIVREFDTDAKYGERQRLLTAAFVDGEMVGTVAVERVSDVIEPGHCAECYTRFWNRFTEHDANIYETLQLSLNRTLIGAPSGSLTIHSLGVATAHRRLGIGRSLIRHAISCLDTNEQLSLYIEFARNRWLRQFGVSLGFAPVRQTFSISERLEYGCWGSVLMQYQTQDEG